MRLRVTYLVAMLVAFLLHSQAQIITSSSPAPLQPAVTGNYFVNNTSANTVYIAPVNSFNDGVTGGYYFLTQDAAKASTSVITYQGIPYSVTTYVTNDLYQVRTTAFGDNKTIFLDEGTYTDTDGDGLAYVRIGYYNNFSMVGLVYNTVKITKQPYLTTGRNNRYLIYHKNIYFENLIFDGEGRNMTTNAEAKSKGEYYFMISGSSAPWDGSTGFVMKNCEIRNVGSSNGSGSNKNVALNIYSSSGQLNFENLSFSNIKSQSGYGILSLNDATGNYFKDIAIDASAANSSNYSVKIENTVPDVAINTVTNVFAGSLQINGGSTNGAGVYKQDYRYSTTYLPSSFNYVAARTSNGSGSSPAVVAFPSLPTVTTNTAYWDLNDNYWIVRSASSSPTVNQQLGYLNTVLNTVNTLGAPNAVPPANVKLVKNGSGVIPTFTQPDMGAKTVNIVAVNSETDAYNSTALIPFVAAGTIGLPTTTAPTTRLYNIDFHTNAFYTLEEAVTGITTPALTDPNEPPATAPSGYPVYNDYKTSTTTRVANSLNSSFENCKFTSLIAELKSVTGATSMHKDDNFTFAAAIAGTASDSYTNTGYTNGLQGTAADQTIKYFSSNPAVLEIDPVTGVATAKSVGTAVIFAKAMDSYNQGEIEKPFILWNVTVDPPLAVSFGGVTATFENGMLLVQWTTQKETDNSHFDIEGSRDGASFTKLGSVSSLAANGNSALPLSYDFTIPQSKAAGLLGLSLFSIGFVLLWAGRKNKWLAMLVLVAGIGACVQSCSKKDAGVQVPGSKLYIRVAQVEKGGTIIYSKTIEVVKK